MVTKQKTPYLIFAVDDLKMAIKLEHVEQVFSAVEVTPLTGAPEAVLGLINVHGAIIVVLNVRKRLHLHERSVELSDQIVIVNVDDRQLALLVDEVVEVLHALPEEFEANEIPTTSNRLPSKAGLSTGDNKTLLYELKNFLSADDAEKLTTALQASYTHQ